MLAPDARAVLLDELRPPVDYELDAAVATTFTLDLAAALIPPLAFASFQLRGTPDPVAALEAVRSCADRVDLFCQAGEITVPAQASDLMAFLEPMIHEVRRPRPGHLFHPKIWLLRYRRDEDLCYRLLCLTRNLTQDHSWDVVLRLDGRRLGGPKAANRPLAQLLRSLPAAVRQPIPGTRTERIRLLADDVRRVEWEKPTDVKEIAFHVYGVSGTRPAADFAGYRHLVVAPFINDAGVDTVAPPGSHDVTVVSNVDGLDRLMPSTVSRVHPRIISTTAGLDERDDGDMLGGQQILTGLHAKMYVVERSRRAHVYLGSANATDAAFGGNVEILVELVGGATRLGVERFLGDDASFRALLEDYATEGGVEPDPADQARRALDDLIRDLAAVSYSVAVMPKDDGYELRVASSRSLRVPDDYSVTLELLTRPGNAHHLKDDIPVNVLFHRVPIPDITPFLALRATSLEGLKRGTVVRAELVNDPAGRLDEVLARQVNTPEKFLRFLALLLGIGNPQLLTVAPGAGEGNSSHAFTGSSSGILELVLCALAEHPDAVADLDRLVTRLRRTEHGRAVLPHGFSTVWPVVMAAHARLPEAGAR